MQQNNQLNIFPLKLTNGLRLPPALLQSLLGKEVHNILMITAHRMAIVKKVDMDSRLSDQINRVCERFSLSPEAVSYEIQTNAGAGMCYSQKWLNKVGCTRDEFFLLIHLPDDSENLFVLQACDPNTFVTEQIRQAFTITCEEGGETNVF